MARQSLQTAVAVPLLPRTIWEVAEAVLVWILFAGTPPCRMQWCPCFRAHKSTMLPQRAASTAAAWQCRSEWQPGLSRRRRLHQPSWPLAPTAGSTVAQPHAARPVGLEAIHGSPQQWLSAAPAACKLTHHHPSSLLLHLQGLKAQGLYWNQDTSLQCFTGAHAWLAYGVGIPMLILFCAGFPVGLALALWRHRNSLDNTDTDLQAGVPMAMSWARAPSGGLYARNRRLRAAVLRSPQAAPRQHMRGTCADMAVQLVCRRRSHDYRPSLCLQYGFVYDSYQRRYYFWECIILAEKFALVVAVTLMQQVSSAAQVLVAMGIIFLAFILQVGWGERFSGGQMGEGGGRGGQEHRLPDLHSVAGWAGGRGWVV